MSTSQNLEKSDETTNENIKMVLLGTISLFSDNISLVLEENDKNSTNDNLDNPAALGLPFAHFLLRFFISNADIQPPQSSRFGIMKNMMIQAIRRSPASSQK